jgi:hypothetical protein
MLYRGFTVVEDVHHIIKAMNRCPCCGLATFQINPCGIVLSDPETLHGSLQKALLAVLLCASIKRTMHGFGIDFFSCNLFLNASKEEHLIAQKRKETRTCSTNNSQELRLLAPAAVPDNRLWRPSLSLLSSAVSSSLFSSSDRVKIGSDDGF